MNVAAWAGDAGVGKVLRREAKDAVSAVRFLPPLGNKPQVRRYLINCSTDSLKLNTHLFALQFVAHD